MSKQSRLGSGSASVGERFEGLTQDEAQLMDSEFEDCVFVRSTFRQVEFRSCRFADCVFERCDLSLVRLPGTVLSGVVFKECKIVGVNWTEAGWRTISLHDPVKFMKSILNESTFLGIALPGLELIDCVAHNVDFRESDLKDADFSGTSLEGSMFAGADLSGADLRRARGYAIDARETVVEGGRFALPEAISLLAGLGVEVGGWEDE